MIRIAHISDLHFGRHLPRLSEALIAAVERMRPTLVALSGDLTQRARPEEFAAAANFIRLLPRPLLVVPGNHDIPGWNPVRRFINPWRHWRHYISSELEPCIREREFIAIGVQTARRAGLHLDWSRGRISQSQLDRIERLAAAAEPDSLRVLVAHHPFVAPALLRRRGLVGRANRALSGLHSARIDLILGGHLHQGHAGIANGIVVAQAGTAISSRHKGEPNAFNRISASPCHIQIDSLHWDGAEFAARRRWTFQRDTTSEPFMAL